MTEAELKIIKENTIHGAKTDGWFERAKGVVEQPKQQRKTTEEVLRRGEEVLASIKRYWAEQGRVTPADEDSDPPMKDTAITKAISDVAEWFGEGGAKPTPEAPGTNELTGVEKDVAAYFGTG